MRCQKCGAEFAEYQCSNCGALVCKNCHREVDGKTFCKDCVPNKGSSLQGLKSSIITVAILAAGSALILYIGNHYAQLIPSAESLGGLLGVFKSLGFIIVGGLGVLLLILVVAYIVLRRRV